MTPNADGLYAKTAKGREELAKRNHGLPRATRSVLILLDGKSPLSEMLRLYGAIASFGHDVESLLEQGFIVEVPRSADDGSRSRDSEPRDGGLHDSVFRGSALRDSVLPDSDLRDSQVRNGLPADWGPGSEKQGLIDVARRLLGGHAGPVVARLEKSAQSQGDLLASVESCYKLIRLTIDEKKAEQFRDLGRRALSKGG